MTTTDTLPPVDLDEPAVAAKVGPQATADAEVPINPTLVGLSALLATTAAGWMFAGVFSGSFARVVGVFGALLGVGLCTLSYRTSRGVWLRLMAAPAALLVGVLLVLPSSGSGDPVTQVRDVFRNGGLGFPPVPFDPGWRPVLLFYVTVLGAAATTFAVGLRRPKLAIVIPAPFIFLAALRQPADATLVSTSAALVLLIAAFGASYAVDLAKEGASSGSFELRRIGRAAVALLVLVGVMVGLSKTSFLLPAADNSTVVPPQFPQTPPPQPDRELFTVTAPEPLPLRLGVLDVYSTTQTAWLTPPYDTSRFQTLPEDGAIRPGTKKGETPAIPPPADKAPNVTVRFQMKHIGGHLLPTVANPLAVPHRGFELQYDPRTQTLREPGAVVSPGSSYDVVAPAVPSGDALAKAGPPPAQLKEYLEAPEAPDSVAKLLEKAPKNPFQRLQYVRNLYYKKVVASGSGNPVPMPPDRVAEMLAGKPGTPFEIVAAEALLARWVGVPSRIGYGYFSSNPVEKGAKVYSLRPRDGSVWLEVYFDRYGWVPVIGSPPKAASSLDNQPKKQSTATTAALLNMLLYVPVKEHTYQALYVVVQWWALRVVPALLGLGLLYFFYPALLKTWRRERRRRWASAVGPRGRLAVAYAELRDSATDLNVGYAAQTPLEFCERAVEVDEQHEELAWLVTRVFWGDMTRDVNLEHVDLAEDMARSVRRRLWTASPAVNRMVALGSRASLRDPYTQEIPNAWLQVRISLRPWRLVRRLRRRAPAMAAVLALFIGIAGCGGTPSLEGPAVAFPSRMPAVVDGVNVHEELAIEAYYAKSLPKAAVVDGRARMFTMHSEGQIQGSLQIAMFKQGYSANIRKVRDGMLRGLGARNFKLTRVNGVKLWVAEIPSEGQRILVWFPPNGRYYELIDSRIEFSAAPKVFVDLLIYQGVVTPASASSAAPPLDPHRGSDFPTR